MAVGGDGTVNEIARAMIHSNAILGIIPKGSGNGLARELHIPMDVKRAIDLIAERACYDDRLLPGERTGLFLYLWSRF